MVSLHDVYVVLLKYLFPLEENFDLCETHLL